jgi:tripartite-type tricarboxylate transporter receptor subunit TctC
MTGTRMLHIPYKGGGPSVIGLVSGEAAVGFTTTPSCITQLQAGRLRGLAVTTAKRSPVMPELPTIAEQGFPGFEAVSWYALMVPAETPQDVIAKLHAETSRILKLPEVRDKLAALGAEPVGNSPQELAATIRGESARWSEVIRRQGIKVD